MKKYPPITKDKIIKVCLYNTKWELSCVYMWGEVIDLTEVERMYYHLAESETVVRIYSMQGLYIAYYNDNCRLCTMLRRIGE